MKVRMGGLLSLMLVLALMMSRSRDFKSFLNRDVYETSVSIKVRTIYYEIEGSTVNELRTQMNLFGPKDGTDRYDAYTEWYIKWSYPYSAEDGGCTTGPVVARADIVVRLPHWKAPNDAPRTLLEKWNMYTAALQTHEEGHKRIAIQAASEIVETLEALPPHPTCYELEKAADAAGEKILERYREQAIVYDRTTDHGATQGARFP